MSKAIIAIVLSLIAIAISLSMAGGLFEEEGKQVGRYYRVYTQNIVDGEILSEDIADKTVALEDIANGSIHTQSIADGEVATADILNSTIISEDISDGEVKTADILDGTILGGDIGDGEVATADIADGTVTDSDIDQSNAYFLNYSDAGAYTAQKILVANGTSGVTDAGTTITEGGLSAIDYVTVTCTSNTSAYATASVSGNDITVAVYDVGDSAYTGAGEYVNWTAVGSP